jgi:hypothetical protein
MGELAGFAALAVVEPETAFAGCAWLTPTQGAATDGATTAMTNASAPTTATAAAAGASARLVATLRPAPSSRSMRSEMCLRVGKTERIRADGADEGEHPVVASHFALEVELLTDKLGSRIPAQKRGDDPLQPIGPIVGATQMSELVQTNLIDFWLRELVK